MLNYSLTPPSATPATMYLDSAMYTMMIGTIAIVISMYTLPISNLRKSALLSAAIRIGSVFLLLSEMTRAGMK